MTSVGAVYFSNLDRLNGTVEMRPFPSDIRKTLNIRDLIQLLSQDGSLATAQFFLQDRVVSLGRVVGPNGASHDGSFQPITYTNLLMLLNRSLTTQ